MRRLIYSMAKSFYEDIAKYEGDIISNIIGLISSSLYATFYFMYPGYALPEEYSYFSETAYDCGLMITGVLTKDGIIISGVSEKCAGKNALTADADDIVRLFLVFNYWKYYLLLRNIRKWLSGKKELICPIYEFYEFSLDDNRKCLETFCNVDCQEPEYCSIANNEFNPLKAKKMQCPFGNLLFQLFGNYKKVKVLI
jgi:hypothetical protein